MTHNAHDLKFTVLNQVSRHDARRYRPSRTLNLLSCNTRLMAASSPEGESLVWNTTPKDPLPTILHCVYCMSRVSPVTPSCTFSRMTSANRVSRLALWQQLSGRLTSHPQTRKGCRPILRHRAVQNKLAISSVVGWSCGSLKRELSISS